MYDKEELEIIDYIENKNPGSVENVQEEKKRYKKIFEANFTKKKSVNLRLLEGDLAEIKRRALSEGIPYRTMIGSIIHSYLNGTLVKK